MTQRQELALTGGAVNLNRPADLFTKKLWALATADAAPEDSRAKALAIAENPELRAEAARLLPALQQMLETRPSNDELGAALQPLLIVKRKPDFGKGKAGEQLTMAWQAVYYGQLRRFPIAAVRAAVKDLLGSHVYPDMPQPAEIVQAAEPYAAKIRTAQYRLKRAIEHRPPPVIDPAERAKVRELMKQNGWLDAEGNFNFAGLVRNLKRAGPTPAYRRPAETPQQMAERLRQAAK